MPAIPLFLLKKLYVKGSLRTEAEGFGLTIRNTLAPGTITGISPLEIDGQVVPLEKITIGKGNNTRPADKITPASPFPFGLNDEANLLVKGMSLEPGTHSLTVTVKTKEVGELNIQVEDSL